jgi:DNA-binding transcriptional LysR family regulator
MDLGSLHLFVDLAETKSFSKTAERNFMSQSAVSQRIRALEQSFGYVLVERGKGRPGAHFTEAGTRLLIGARDLLARADALKREMAELAGEVSGTLRVATVYSIGLHAITPAISRFLAEFPQVNLHVEYLRTNRIYDALVAGSIECGIVACPRELPQVEVVPLTEEEMVVILPPGHPLSENPSLPLAALEGLPFVGFDHDIPTRTMTDEALREHGVTVEVVHEFDNIETIKRVVEIGLGVAIVPEPTVRREVRDETLTARPLSDVALKRPTGVLLRKGHIRGNALSRFLDVLTGGAAAEAEVAARPSRPSPDEPAALPSPPPRRRPGQSTGAKPAATTV